MGFLILLSKKKAKYSELLSTINIPPSTLSSYLKILIQNDVISRHKIGYENIYSIEETDRVTKVLITYKGSFLDKLVDKTLNTWLETQFRKETKRKQ